MNKIEIKDRVTPKTLISIWLYSIMFFIGYWRIDPLHLWDQIWTIYLVSLTIIIVGAIFGFKQASITGVALDFLKILQQPGLTPLQMMTAIREIIHKLIGFDADINLLFKQIEAEIGKKDPPPSPPANN